MTFKAQQAQRAAPFLRQAAAEMERGGDVSAAITRAVAHNQKAAIAAIAALIDVAASISNAPAGLVVVAPQLEELLRSAAAAGRVTREVAGEPELLDDPEATVTADDPFRVARVRGELQHVIFSHELYSAAALGGVLGSQGGGAARERARALRERGDVVGVPVGNAYAFPTFQVDVAHGRIFPIVVEINHLLGAGDDPWGVAAWWFAREARLAAVPADLVADAARADDLRLAAKLDLAPVY
jgi:hypothetical protein